MATWISNFLSRLHLERSAEPFILNVLYDQTLSENDKSANIFDFLETQVKAANVNLQDAVSELFAQYQRNALYMMVAPEYFPRPQHLQLPPQQQSGTTTVLRPPVKEFVPKSALAWEGQSRQDIICSEDDAEIHGVDPTKSRGQPQNGEAWARIDDDDDNGRKDGGQGQGNGNNNGEEVFTVPSSQIYGEGEEVEREGGYEQEEQGYYEDDQYYEQGGYDYQWQSQPPQEQGGQHWADDLENDEFNPFAPPSVTDMQVLQSVQGLSPYTGYTSTMHQPHYSWVPHSNDPNQGYYNPYNSTSFDAYQQQQQEETATMDMTPLEMLQRILSDMEPKQIEQAFEENGHDMDAALTAIMAKRKQGSQQAATNDPLQQFIPRGDPRSTQTCRFFLQGKCLRKDCWYSHDLESVVCRYWLKGECLKGTTCEFSHGLDAGKLTEVVEAEPVKKQAPPSMDEWDFPSLSSPAKPASSKGGSNNNKSNGTKSLSSTRSSKDAAVDALAEDLNSKAQVGDRPATTAATTKPPGLSYSATAAKAASKPLTSLRQQSSEPFSFSNSQPKFNLAMAPSSIPWLETGSVLNQQYLEARAKASEYASARNRCFEKATQAYLRNDGAAASRYSAEGRRYNELMMATHRQASEQIFATRNAHTVKGRDGSRNETWIDLHGLHVEESLVFLDQFMEKLENEAYTGVVYVVTGTGHHSHLGHAKVRYAVLEWLVDWGYVHREISVDGVHGGLVAVQVIRGRP